MSRDYQGLIDEFFAGSVKSAAEVQKLFDFYCGPVEAHAQLISVSVSVGIDFPSGHDSFEGVFDYDAQAVLRRETRACHYDAHRFISYEERRYDGQGRLLFKNGYYSRTQLIEHWRYIYEEGSDHSPKLMIERYSPGKPVKKTEYSSVETEYGDVALEFWLMDRRTADSSYTGFSDLFGKYSCTEYDGRVSVGFNGLPIIHLVNMGSDGDRLDRSFPVSHGYAFNPESGALCIQELPWDRRSALIPASIAGYPIEALEVDSCDNCPELAQLYISPGVREIRMDDIFRAIPFNFIYLPESIRSISQMFLMSAAQYEELIFLVHEGSYAHERCLQEDCNFALAGEAAVSYQAFCRWVESKSEEE